MSLSSDLLTIANLYAERAGLPLSTISSRALDDSKRLSQIAQGAGITVRRYEHMMCWFSDRWPDGCEWPVEIHRPDPSSAEAA